MVRNSFVEAEVDDLLAETDELLIALWHELDLLYVDISHLFLWMSDYFLFRLCDEQLQFRSRYFNVIEQMPFRIVQLFQKLEHSAIYVDLFSCSQLICGRTWNGGYSELMNKVCVYWQKKH